MPKTFQPILSPSRLGLHLFHLLPTRTQGLTSPILQKAQKK